MVANRLPVRRTGVGDSSKWTTSDGGLVTALRPVLRAPDRSGVWVGWTGTASPAQSVHAGEREGRDEPAFEVDGIRMQPVALTQREVDAFYHGFSNRTIWPLYHDGIRAPEFDESWWHAYESVNERFARAIARTVRPGDVVWIHDYHLQLVPSMLRRLSPGVRIGVFLHIPFPPRELFGWLPWRRELAEGLLGADVIGFQTDSDARNFVSAAARFADVREEPGRTPKTSERACPSTTGDDHHAPTRVRIGDRPVQVGGFPISIDFDEFSTAATDPAVVRAAATIRRKIGPDRRILLGVDRLDYTKGIDLRLTAFERALQSKRLSVEDCVLIQIAVPSREPVPEYGQMRERIEGLVGRINGEHAVPGRVAVHYFRRSLPRKDLLAYYLAADAMVVTPFRDGMNLVAKEYVACRNDDSGALVLSETAGAAEELAEAILVNPRDPAGVCDAMVRAVSMSADESAQRMSALRARVRARDVHRWAARFLGALSQ